MVASKRPKRLTDNKSNRAGSTSKAIIYCSAPVSPATNQSTKVSAYRLTHGPALDIIHRPGGEVRIGVKSLRSALRVPTGLMVVLWGTAVPPMTSGVIGPDRPASPIHDRATISIPAAALLASIVRSRAIRGMSFQDLEIAAEMARLLLEEWEGIKTIQRQSRRVTRSAVTFGG